MGLIAYYRERERQPEHLAAPNTRSPYWRDGSIVVTGRRLSADIGQAAAISGSPASGTTQHGVGPVVATGVVPSVAIGAATQFTLLIALRPSAVNGYQRVFSRSDTLVSMFGNLSAGGIDLSIPHSGVTGWWDINSGGFVANRDYVIAISYDGTGTSNDPVASVNGRRVSVSRFTAPTGTLSSTAGTLVLGNRADGQRAIGGPLPLFAWIPAAFDQAAIDSLTGNPWQLYEDEVIWVPVSAGGGASIDAQAGALSISSAAPTVSQSANQSLTAGAGSVTLQGFAPTVAQSQSVAPGAGALTISGFAPAVSQSASGAVAPDAGAVTLTGYAPSIAQPQTAAPGSGALTITGYAPEVQQASGVLPGAGSITITGLAPTVAQTAAQSVAPGAGPLSITGYAPDIAQSGQPQAPSGGVIFGRPPWAKRYVVQHGRRVLVFGTEAAALEAQAAIDKARTIRETAPAATSNRARRRVEKIARSVIASALSTQPPVDSFTASQLQELAATYASSDTLAELQRLRDFEQMARMWEDLRAEEDDIAAFMELM